jgi:hypothetical protein
VDGDQRGGEGMKKNFYGIVVKRTLSDKGLDYTFPNWKEASDFVKLSLDHGYYVLIKDVEELEKATNEGE